MAPNQLGTLPHEMLVKILRYALVSAEQPVRFADERHRNATNDSSYYYRDPGIEEPILPSQKLEVLLVSKAIYFAGIEAYFGSTAFRFYSESVLKRLVAAIGPDRKRHIHKVVLHLDQGHTARVSKGKDDSVKMCFQSLPSLQKVTVEHWKSFRSLCEVEGRKETTESGRKVTEAYVEQYWAVDGVEIEYSWT